MQLSLYYVTVASKYDKEAVKKKIKQFNSKGTQASTGVNLTLITYLIANCVYSI